MKKTLGIITIALTALSCSVSYAATEVLRYYLPNQDGMDFRLRNNAFYDGLSVKVGANTATVGYVGDGQIFMSFVRFSINDHLMPNETDSPIPFEVLQQATSIVLKTGITGKEYSRAADNEFGGVITDWFVVPDLFNAMGYNLDALTFDMWDVPNNPKSVFVIQTDPAGTVAMPSGRSAPAEEFNFDVDVTAAVKAAINNGTLTSTSQSFAIAAFPAEVPYWNADTQSYITDDPGHNPHRNWAFQMRSLDGDPEKGITYLEVTIGGATWAGYPVDASGYVNTGSFLGQVYPEGDWVYSVALSQWIYMPESLVSQSGSWGFVVKP